MCFDLKEYYTVRIEYPAYSIGEIQDIDAIFDNIAENYKEHLLNGGGSGCGFGYRDVDWDIKTEQVAEKIYEEMEKKAQSLNTEQFEIEVSLYPTDQYECYVDAGCKDCYFAKGEINE